MDFQTKPGAAHTLDKFYSSDIEFTEFAEAFFTLLDSQAQPNTLVVTQRILRNTISITNFNHLHRHTSGG